MKKKALSLFLALMMLLTLIPTVALASSVENNSDSNVAISVDKTEAGAGETVTVTISNKAMTVSTFTGGFEFDPAHLHCESIVTCAGYDALAANCTLISPQISTVAEANASGKVGFGFVSTTMHKYSAAPVLTITFTVLDEDLISIVGYEDSAGDDACNTDTDPMAAPEVVIVPKDAFVIDIVPETETAHPGGTVTYSLMIKNNPGFFAMNGDIVYDKTMLRLTDFTAGETFKTNGGSFLGTPNENCFSWDAMSNVSEDGVLCTMTFEVLDVPIGAKIVGPTFDLGGEGVIANDRGEEFDFYALRNNIVAAHCFDSGVVTTPATCTKDGVRTYTCSVCAETKTEVIEATGHSVVIDAAKEPTCIETGLTEGSHCANCNEVFVAQETIPMKEHTYADGVVTPATADADGSIEDHCTECGDVRTRTFAYNDADIQLSIGSAKAHRGEMTVPVTFTKTADVSKLALTFSYDMAKVTLTGVSEGWTLDGNTAVWTAADSMAPLSLTFTVNVNDDKTVNPGDVDISVASCVTDDDVTVGQTAGMLTVTRAGDINGDGKVNALDVAKLRQFVAKQTSEVVPGSTDVNCDGKNNALDVAKLRQFVAKQIDLIY